jgi:four helix bundle protein
MTWKKELFFSVNKLLIFVNKIKQGIILNPLINQLVRSATSIGANYNEATEASSKKDFTNKICIAKKEAKETQYWLRLIGQSSPEHVEIARNLWKEAHELTLIFSAIVRTSRNN